MGLTVIFDIGALRSLKLMRTTSDPSSSDSRGGMIKTYQAAQLPSTRIKLICLVTCPLIELVGLLMRMSFLVTKKVLIMMGTRCARSVLNAPRWEDV